MESKNTVLFTKNSLILDGFNGLKKEGYIVLLADAVILSPNTKRCDKYVTYRFEIDKDGLVSYKKVLKVLSDRGITSDTEFAYVAGRYIAPCKRVPADVHDAEVMMLES